MKRNGKNVVNNHAKNPNVAKTDHANSKDKNVMAELEKETPEIKQERFDSFWGKLHQAENAHSLNLLLKAVETGKNIDDINIKKHINEVVKLSDNDFLGFWKIAIEQEKANERKANFLNIWDLFSEMQKQAFADAKANGLYENEELSNLINNKFQYSETEFFMLAEIQIDIENDLQELAEIRAAQAELDEQELERLEKENFESYQQETEIEEVITEVVTEILTENPETEMKTQEVVKEKASNETVNNTQNITNNTLNITVETPKPKMSIADKIVEAQKMLVIAERKQLTEDRLKAFHGYLHANKEGDNFRLMSLDEKYSFTTNNIELIKEVNVVLERFFKTKIQEFETELSNFQI